MLSKLYKATFVILMMSPAPAMSKATLTSSVELSEWTPPQVLELSLDTGEYRIAPPPTGWPQGWPLPPKRHGRLDSEALYTVKGMTKRITKGSLELRECRKFPDYAPNGTVGPHHLSIIMNRSTFASAKPECWTSETTRLFNFVNQLFQRQIPMR